MNTIINVMQSLVKENKYHVLTFQLSYLYSSKTYRGYLVVEMNETKREKTIVIESDGSFHADERR